MTLTTQQQILIEQRVTNEAKSIAVAYVLWFFTGSLGGHRYYLGRTGSAVAMTILFVLGLLTIAFGVGAVFLAAVGVWALVDAFLIPGMVQELRTKLRDELTRSFLFAAGTPGVPERVA